MHVGIEARRHGLGEALLEGGLVATMHDVVRDVLGVCEVLQHEVVVAVGGSGDGLFVGVFAVYDACLSRLNQSQIVNTKSMKSP